MKNYADRSIILFDGVCNLCNSSVQFIIKHDKKKQFLFTSLQSDAGQEILLQNKIENLNFKTILLVENNNLFTKSTAILKISKKLNGIYPLFYAFIIVPTFIRDGIYNFISKNRYQWFGKKESCMIPTDDLKERFLE